MPVSMSNIICPYCKMSNSVSKAIGTGGLVNMFGTIRNVTCDRCGKDFNCSVVVDIKYKTTKG